MHISRRTAVRLSLMLPALGIAGCDGMISPYVRRFLYKIVINFDGRDYVASSVYEIRWGRNVISNFDAVGYYSVHAEGQAPFVEIPNVGAIFALLKPPEIMKGFNASFTAVSLAQYAPDDLRKNGGDDLFRYLMNLPGEHDINSPGENRPAVVYFPHDRDFMSVSLVPPAGVSVHGKWLYLSRATLALTDAPVTHKITVTVLPSFDGYAIHPSFLPVPGSLYSERPFGGTIETESFNMGGRRS